MSEKFFLLSNTHQLGRNYLRDLEINPDLDEIRVITDSRYLQACRGAIRIMDPHLGLPTYCIDDVMYIVKSNRMRWWTDDDMHYLRGITLLGLPTD